MITINDLRTFLAEYKTLTPSVGFAQLVIDDSQFVKFLKERTSSDGFLLFGIVPQHPLVGAEDLYQWESNLMFFILKKRSDRASHDEILENMHATQQAAKHFAHYLLSEAITREGKLCAIAHEVKEASLLIQPVWEKAQTDGWAIELDLLSLD